MFICTAKTIYDRPKSSRHASNASIGFDYHSMHWTMAENIAVTRSLTVWLGSQRTVTKTKATKHDKKSPIYIDTKSQHGPGQSITSVVHLDYNREDNDKTVALRPIW